MSTISARGVSRIPGQALPSVLMEDWNRLAGDPPCRRWDWLEPWWRHYRKPGDELFVLAVHDEDDKCMGIAPWYISRSLRHGRVIRFLGSGDVYSDYLTIFSTPEQASSVAEDISEFLCDQAAGEWDMIELSGVPAADSAVTALVAKLSERELVVHQQQGENCWRLPLPGDWESYVKRLSKTRRERTRQIVRTLFDTGRVQSRQVVDASLLPRYFDLLVDLHQKRRCELGQRGCFADSRFRSYHREVIERFFASGRLRLRCAELDGRPIAIEYGLVGGSVIYFYQSGIETDLLAERPGWIGTIASLRAGIAEGFQAYDFMRGDEPYKSSWRAEPHPTVDFRIVANRTSAQLRHTAWLAERHMKQWAKTRLRALGGRTPADT